MLHTIVPHSPSTCYTIAYMSRQRGLLEKFRYTFSANNCSFLEKTVLKCKICFLILYSVKVNFACEHMTRVKRK